MATRPDHVVLAGHTGRLLARAGLTCHTQWEVDENVIATTRAAARDLGRPVTGAELFDLWEAAPTTWAQRTPPEPNRLAELLDRVGQALAARDALDQESASTRRGAAVIRHIALNARPHTRDVLPGWMTDEPVQPSDAWAVLG